MGRLAEELFKRDADERSRSTILLPEILAAVDELRRECEDAQGKERLLWGIVGYRLNEALVAAARYREALERIDRITLNRESEDEQRIKISVTIAEAFSNGAWSFGEP